VSEARGIGNAPGAWTGASFGAVIEDSCSLSWVTAHVYRSAIARQAQSACKLHFVVGAKALSTLHP
jgi:hypothetical protein